jgi:hypothetical protein
MEIPKVRTQKSPGWEQQGEHEKSSTIAVLFAGMNIIVKKRISPTVHGDYVVSNFPWYLYRLKFLL